MFVKQPDRFVVWEPALSSAGKTYPPWTPLWERQSRSLSGSGSEERGSSQTSHASGGLSPAFRGSLVAPLQQRWVCLSPVCPPHPPPVGETSNQCHLGPFIYRTCWLTARVDGFTGAQWSANGNTRRPPQNTGRNCTWICPRPRRTARVLVSNWASETSCDVVRTPRGKVAPQLGFTTRSVDYLQGPGPGFLGGDVAPSGAPLCRNQNHLGGGPQRPPSLPEPSSSLVQILNLNSLLTSVGDLWKQRKPTSTKLLMNQIVLILEKRAFYGG